MAGSVAQAFEHTDTASGVTSVVAATLTGNAIVAACTNDNSTAATITAGDPTNGATSYTLLDDVVDTGDQQRMTTFGKSGSTATGSVNVTFTWSAANSFKAGLAIDCTGVSGALDQHTASYQPTPTLTTDAQTSGTAAILNTQPALVVGIGFNSNGTSAPSQGSTGWSPPVAGVATFWSFGGPVQTRVEFKRVTSTAGVAALFTATSNTNSITAVVVIDETAGAAAQTPFFRAPNPRPWDAPPPPQQRDLGVAAILAPAPPAPDTVLRPLWQLPRLWDQPQLPQQRDLGVAAILGSGAAPSADQFPRASIQTQFPRLWDPPPPPQQRDLGVAAVFSSTSPSADTVLTGTRAQAAAAKLWPADRSAPQPRQLTAAIQPSPFPISTHASGRYFVDSSGNPYEINMWTVWAAMTGSTAEQDALIADMKAQNINAVEFGAIWRDTRASRAPLGNDGALKPFDNNLSGGAWSTSTVTPDYTTPNAAYDAFLLSFVNRLAAAGIVAFVFPSYTGTSGGGGSTPDDGWANEMVANQNADTANMVTYGAHIATLLKNCANVWWGLGGDSGTANRPFTGSERDAVIGMTNGILSVSGQASGLQFGAEWGTNSIGADQTDFLSGSSGPTLGSTLTIQTLYNFFGEFITNAARGFAAIPTKPVMVQEGPFERENAIDGNGFNPSATEPVRRWYCWAWLSGATAGTNLGDGYIWPFNKTGSLPGSDNWQNWLATQGLIDAKNMRALRRSVNWWKLAPTPSIITANAGSGDGSNTSGPGGANTTTVVAATASDGSCILIYYPPDQTGSITVDTTGLSGLYQARNYDVTNGSYTTIGTSGFTHTPSHSTVFSAPPTASDGNADGFIVLEAQASTDTAPSGPIQKQTNSAWPVQQLPVQRRTGIAALLAQPSFAFTVAGTVPPPTSAISLVESFTSAITATVPPPTSAISLVEDFDMSIAATVPVPTAAVALYDLVQVPVGTRQQSLAVQGWQSVVAPQQSRTGVAATFALGASLSVAATVPAPTSAVVLVEDFDMTIAATVPAPTSSISLVEDFDMSVAGTVPVPASSINLTEQAVVPFAPRQQGRQWPAPAAPIQPRTGIAGTLVLPISISIAGTVPAPTSDVELNTPIPSFALTVAGLVPAPTGASTLNETLSTSIAGTVPAPGAAAALAEVFAAAIAGTVPAPAAVVVLSEAFAAAIGATVPAPAAAVALAETFVAAIGGVVPAPAASLVLGGASQLLVAALVPAPLAVALMNETPSVSVAATVPAPTAALAVNNHSVNPTLSSVTPATIFTGGMLVTLAGSNFQTAYPLPQVSGVLPDPLPTVSVLFDGVEGDDVQVYSSDQLTVIAPAHDPGTVSVTVQNLDQNGAPISGEVVTLSSAVTYARADLSVAADFTRVNQTVIRLLKQQVIANVAMETSVDFSDQQGQPLKIVAIANLPAVTLSMPATRIRYGEYAEDADRNEESIGINFNRRSTFRTIDITWQVKIYDNNKGRALNLLALVHQVLKDNTFLTMDRDPSDRSKGQVQYEFYPSGEFNFDDSANNSDLFVAKGSVTLYGFWFEDVASFPEQAVVEKGSQANDVDFTTSVFRP